MVLYNENKINSYLLYSVLKPQIEFDKGEMLWELWINCLREKAKA